MRVFSGHGPADLGEDAGTGGHPAVHHAVEDGQQAIQGEGLGPQQVVTGLEMENTEEDRLVNNKDINVWQLSIIIMFIMIDPLSPVKNIT